MQGPTPSFFAEVPDLALDLLLESAYFHVNKCGSLAKEKARWDPRGKHYAGRREKKWTFKDSP
jgi:hypothetical protein